VNRWFTAVSLKKMNTIWKNSSCMGCVPNFEVAEIEYWVENSLK